MLHRLFKPRAAELAGRALYIRVVEQARQPALYTDYAAPDTAEGRFEMYTLHVVLLLERLRNNGERAGEVAQSLFDTYLKSLDDALREMGVGDLSVGKKMRKLGEAFYGRAKSYLTALESLPDRAPLEAMLGRTVYAGAEQPKTRQLADYLLRQREHLAGQDLETLCGGEVAWIAA